jgi:glycosyltransferase involved in cell wall biosynthesis
MIPGLYILIPAKNEEKNIAKTINNYKRYGKIVIVNDRSSDRTLLFSKKSVHTAPKTIRPWLIKAPIFLAPI